MQDKDDSRTEQLMQNATETVVESQSFESFIKQEDVGSLLVQLPEYEIRKVTSNCQQEESPNVSEVSNCSALPNQKPVVRIKRREKGR